MRVLIAGGGIGGLAAAIALRSAGHQPTVLEQAPELGFVGQGIGLGANAIKALRFLGAADDVYRVAVPTRGWAYHALDGTPQFEIPIDKLYGNEQYISTHRADLLDALTKRLNPGDLRLSARIIEVQESAAGVSVALMSGEAIEGDLLVGADGVKSVVRDYVAGATDSLFSRFVAWRSAVGSNAAPVAAARGELRMWSGSAKFFVLYPIRSNLVNLSAYVPADEAERESWTAGGDINELRAVFSDACEEVQTALDGVENVLLTGVYVRDPLEHWTTDRIALLGDAAHAMGPFSGNGGATAIEDAVTLAICLEGVETAAQAAVALRAYERRRIPRLNQLMTDARVRVSYLNDPNPDTPRIRAGIWAGTMRLDPQAELEYGWLYGHDPVAAARTPADQLDVGGETVLRRPEARRAYDLWRGALTFHDLAGAWQGRRNGYERFIARAFPAPEETEVEHGVSAGVPVTTVGRGGVAPGGPVVLHLHGGGFAMGSADGAVELAVRLGEAAKCRVVIPDYRLAPEHPHPASQEDVFAVYCALLAEAPGRPVFITGEDAGGALAIEICLAARESGHEQPAAVFAISPFCDLSASSPSMIHASARRDPWMTRAFATSLAAWYIQKADPDSPDVSPTRADLSGLPPLLVAAAAEESLFDDAVALVAAAKLAGVDTSFYVAADSVHSFPLFAFLPEADEVLHLFAQMVGRAIPQRNPATVSPLAW